MPQIYDSGQQRADNIDVTGVVPHTTHPFNGNTRMKGQTYERSKSQESILAPGRARDG